MAADMEEDLFHEDHAVDFVMWLSENYPDALYKYRDDVDQGREAFEQLYEQFKNSNE